MWSVRDKRKCVAAFARSADSATDGVKYLKSTKTAVVIKIKKWSVDCKRCRFWGLI